MPSDLFRTWIDISRSGTVFKATCLKCGDLVAASPSLDTVVKAAENRRKHCIDCLRTADAIEHPRPSVLQLV